MRCYYYLHQNKTLIYKPAYVVETGGGPWDYFDSPFVTRWWVLETNDRNSLIDFLVEARNLGALEADVKRIEENSNVTEKDYICQARIAKGDDPDTVIKEIFG